MPVNPHMTVVPAFVGLSGADNGADQSINLW